MCGSWEMIEDYYKFNQKVFTIATAVLNIVSLLQQINKYKGLWYAATDMVNPLFYITTRNNQK